MLLVKNLMDTQSGYLNRGICGISFFWWQVCKKNSDFLFSGGLPNHCIH